jgi:LysM repeat protein
MRHGRSRAQIASSVRRHAVVYEGMDRRFPAKGRLGLLAAPLVTAALALSACGGPARTGGSASSNSSAPTVTAPATSGSASTNGSASGDSSGSSDASVTNFCLTWRLTAQYFNQDVTILRSSDPAYNYSTLAVFLQPTINGINADLTTADQQTPAVASADMATLSSYWSNINADFQAQTDANAQVTVGQVMAYMLANPPGQSATIEAALQDLSSYLAATCNVTIDS